ncbi:MAG: hypothetical protein A3H69_04765 [Candidatus Sungbacteria bacterium RIFCSPLOWO2_02_FULL_47_9]|uniref:TRASH domain-containing protein n=1 Tax=Candidatus Sungbacteria bacterium RIFCSPHIGHO2_01_FULL_47_32 TaxID=1802264 RepID=A0A1G2K251_9BACT|nr:MAG: YHS domain-containing protein [Parcubacteria group bacterium GW2011_GWA2_47_10]OGZ93504.1 MAG: hypothetical protein A2633_06470 [Candidatus Sungbacteria bacterium RIFCSPHIGHO2_01_FULL_47_32]OGZ97959.1 MAG: hypothetical protein A3D57_05040 [Candidatus Sungbacteria bacterium RIFCSPHIGHO2_02_FULL_46_12]OHA04403.1 MAG: hypothetical protein A3A28_03720 [Candidatus Sungbacteria bacterium RIFCSPLOWO2_01_FULL_47_32]OHA11906.1 MAG: hypothetical protein A3H69_04765 [Candidatus Sungbacteria bacter
MFNFLKVFQNTGQGKSLKDPVCGMQTGGAITVEYRGNTYGFCSEHCKQQFEKSPEAYNAK